MNQWPIKPKFLRRITNNSKTSLTEDDLNEYGIFTKASLQGFLAVVTNDILIDNSASLIEFIPKSRKNRIDNDEFVSLINSPSCFHDLINEIDILKTDSKKFRALNQVCEFCNTKSISDISPCDRSNIIAFLNAIPELSEENYKKTIVKFMEKNSNDFGDIDLEIFVQKDHNYIQYHCKATGFIELYFPIFFENNIIALLLVSGIIPENLAKKTILTNVKNYFDSLNLDSVNSLDKCIEHSYRNSSKYISTIKRNCNIQVTGSNPLQLRIESILEHLIILEERIKKRINLHRYRYISENFMKIKNQLNNSIDFNIKENNLHKVAQAINESLICINNAFPNNGFIIIFGVKDFSNSEILQPIASFGSKKNINKYYFETRKITKLIAASGNTFTNHEERDIVDGLLIRGNNDIDYNHDEDILRYFKTKSPKVSFIIWKNYDENWNFPSLSRSIEKLFTDAMLEYYTTIALNYSIVWGKIIENNLEDVIRVTSHEAGQIIPRLKDTLESNFSSLSQIDFLLKTNIYNHKYNDLTLYIKILTVMQGENKYICS